MVRAPLISGKDAADFADNYFGYEDGTHKTATLSRGL